jgi:hypothetical protein
MTSWRPADPVWQHPDEYEDAVDAYVRRRAVMLGIPPHLVSRPDGVQLDALGADIRKPERVDFAGLNRAAAKEMERRQMRAYGDSLARAQPLTADDFAAVVGEQVARDEYELGSGGPWVEIVRGRYPSERWERIPVDQVRYPGLARRVARRASGRTPMWLMIAGGAVCAVLTLAGVPVVHIAASVFGIAAWAVAWRRWRHTA